MGYLDLVRDMHSPVSRPSRQYEINELDELSPNDPLAPLYSRLKAIYDSPDFDSPAMRAERSMINMTIHRATYCGLTCNCFENAKVRQ